MSDGVTRGAELPDDPLAVFDLRGRVAVVTGAAGGVGRGCAEILAAAGAHVMCVDRQSPEETVRILAARGQRGEAAVFDVTDKAAFDAFADDVVARHGRIDVLVNNAAILLRERAIETSEDTLDRLFATNTKGVVFGSQAVGRIMLRQRSGSIINIVTEAIDRSVPDVLAYAGSKAAVRQFTRSLATEWSPSGVRVNAIAPGWMLTPLTRPLSPSAGDVADDAAVRAQLEARAAMVPIGRTGTPADVAYAVLYLASDASSWMTGQALRLNGGGAMPW